MSRKVSFGTFYLMWARRMSWTVPSIHWIAIHWLENRGGLAVLRCFRGFGKSTIIDVYFAWRIYCTPGWRILLQSEADPTALKNSRDTQNVLRNHPLTRGLLEDTGTVESWWTHEGKEQDPRNPQFFAKGAMSNVTGARADEIVNDDVEVPRNITTPEMREKLRYRLEEQTHIAVPGARKLFIGTPHAFDSIYDEEESKGADCLTIPLFNAELRIEEPKGRTEFAVEFEPVYVFSGIGKGAKLLRPDVDYVYSDGFIRFAISPRTVVDIYGESAWPERFDRDELLKRRRETRTLGGWDSQYLLRSRPVHKLRLDPERLREYNCEIEFKRANGVTTAFLGGVQLSGCSCYWDVATGKRKSDASAVSLVLQDTRGHYYWHYCDELEGDFAEFNDAGQINGGQVWQLRQIVIQFNIPRVTVEVNGPGSFTGKLLRQALKGLRCAVVEITVTSNKQQRILDGLEGPLTSSCLWAHTRVLDGPMYEQMQEFNPDLTNQDDDFLDSGSGAILEQPVKIASVQHDNPVRGRAEDWRQTHGTYDIQTEH
ncbi:phage terminase large subunit [Enterobacter roggenkampii]|uniref:phage terminase large subunit n=1 Tax=Enterobacter roggenkampii TaxID=1812935 RepID=UPI003218FD63